MNRIRLAWSRTVSILPPSLILVGVGLFAGSQVLAQDYPSRPVKIVVPLAAGGPTDVTARRIGLALQERLGQPVVIENRTGAGAAIGIEFVARSKPDGYTLLMGTPFLAIGESIAKNLPYDRKRDLLPVALVERGTLVLVVSPTLPVKTVAELVAYGKANPGKLSYGSVGTGSTTHLAGEILATMANVNMLHVPYKGAAPVMTDLLGGQINCTFLNIAALMPYIKSGQVRPIGVSTLKRSPLLSELPAIAETYPGFEVNSWYGMMAPAKTPANIVNLLQKEIAKILQMPEIIQTLQAVGLAVEGTTPEQYAEQIKRDLSRWETAVAKAGIQKQ